MCVCVGGGRGGTTHLTIPLQTRVRAATHDAGVCMCACAAQEGGWDPLKDRKLPSARAAGGVGGVLSRFLASTVDELFEADRLFDEYAVDKLCNFIISLSV